MILNRIHNVSDTFQAVNLLHRHIFLESGCYTGYKLLPGHIPGQGQIEEDRDTDNIGCAVLCNIKEDCCSYEHSKLENCCYLNTDCSPTKKQLKDFQFCVKG